LQNVLELSPISSGLVLLWLAGGAFLASAIGGAMSGKLSPARAVQIGVLLELVGVAGVGLFASTETGWVPLAPLLFIYGIGVGLATAQLTGVIMVDVPDDKSGQGSGSQSTVRQIGSALGIAVLGTMLFSGTQASLETKLDDLGVPEQSQVLIVDAVVDSAGGAIVGLEAGLSETVGAAQAAQIQDDAEQAFTEGAKLSAWAAAIFLMLGFLSTFRLGRKAIKTT
jgi:fucose permease